MALFFFFSGLSRRELWYVSSSSTSLYSPLAASKDRPSAASASSSDSGPTMVQRKVALPAAAASLVGTRHSMTLSAGMKKASPRLARRSVMLRTAFGIGMVTTTSCNVGPEALFPNMGVDLPDPLVPRLGREAGADVDAPGKIGDRTKRTSKSAPVRPRDLETSMETGSCRFVFDQVLRSGLEGMRFTS